MEKNSALNKWYRNSGYPHVKKMNLDPYLVPYIRINLKWTKDLTVNTKVIKLLEEKVDVNLCEFWFDNSSLDLTLKIQATNEKIDKLNFIRIRNCVSEANMSQKWKDNPQNGRRLLSHICKKDLMSIIYLKTLAIQ